MKSLYQIHIEAAAHDLERNMATKPNKRLVDLCAIHHIIAKEEYNFIIGTQHKSLFGTRSLRRRKDLNKRMCRAITKKLITFPEYEAKRKAAAAVNHGGFGSAEVLQ